MENESSTWAIEFGVISLFSVDNRFLKRYINDGYTTVSQVPLGK